MEQKILTHFAYAPQILTYFAYATIILLPSCPPPQLAVLYQAMIRPIMILATFAKDHSVEQSSHLFALMCDFMCLSTSLMLLWKGIGDSTGNLTGPLWVPLVPLHAIFIKN